MRFGTFELMLEWFKALGDAGMGSMYIACGPNMNSERPQSQDYIDMG